MSSCLFQLVRARALTLYARGCSEGDRLSGLVADVLGDTVIIAPSAAWAERYKDNIIASVIEATGCQDIRWRPSKSLMVKEGLDVGVETPLSNESEVCASNLRLAALNDPAKTSL